MIVVSTLMEGQVMVAVVVAAVAAVAAVVAAVAAVVAAVVAVVALVLVCQDQEFPAAQIESMAVG